jgi:hypothetical protein
VTTIDLDDPFATPEQLAAPIVDRKKLITAGRYRLPNRDGSEKKGGWQRVTNLCSAISDQFGLRTWETEQIIIAAAVGPFGAVEARMRELFAAMGAMDKSTKRLEIELFLDFCKGISGGDEGAKFGTGRHSLVEADHLGIPPAASDGYARQHMYLYRNALERNALSAASGMQERRVLVEELEAVGTLDNIVHDLDTGGRHIADLKTTKKFWTWLEVGAQLACYANAVAMWEPSTTEPDNPRAGHWADMPPVSKEIAMVLHMPREATQVDVYEVDIVAGWKTAQLCREVVLDRAGGKRAKNPRAWLREARPITLVERYAARFHAVETDAEGRALVAEAKAKGVWCQVLADEAKNAYERLAPTRNLV